MRNGWATRSCDDERKSLAALEQSRLEMDLHRRWRRAGPLGTLPLTLGTSVAGFTILAAGLVTADLSARLLGSLASVFGVALALMSLFAKLTREKPVAFRPQRKREIVSNLALGLGGVLSLGYGIFAVRLDGKTVIPYGWFSTYGFLAVVVSFALSGRERGAPFKSTSRRRMGLVVISIGLVFLALSLAYPFLQETPGFTPAEVESLLLPIAAGILLIGWSNVRGYA
jgi:hypothetical protein